MNDDDYTDIDGDSSDCEEGAFGDCGKTGGGGKCGKVVMPKYSTRKDKRAYLNAKERKRRKVLRKTFVTLKETIPDLQEETGQTRRYILKRTAEHITSLERKRERNKQEIEDLNKQNAILEAQLQAIAASKDAENGFVASNHED